MSVVKINAIEVPEGAGPELEARFAARAGAVEDQPGFQYFQLLRPVEGENRYFVMTWWADEESFQAWMNSQDFARGHANAGGSGAEGGHGGHGGAQKPVASGSSLLSFEVVEQTGPAGG
ncbi:MAG: antibiotic biosynthesis monooxygenase [Microthrixaceae bacterium]|nr:antibiotic biosynthesis monooxygenase [Microthrixaceae bacterium]